MPIAVENLKRGKEVKFNSQNYSVVQWHVNDDGTCRVEIIKGEWNPFWVNLSKLEET